MRKVLLLIVVLLVGVVAAVPAFAQEATQEATVPTIAEVVVGAASADIPEFTTLLAAVSAADPAVLEALSNPEATLTVFAPTDAAFAALAEALGEEAFSAILADPAALTDILLFHVLGSVVDSTAVTGLFGEMMEPGRVPVETLNGQSIDVTLARNDALSVNGASLVTLDIMASNGVIHVIDAVLVPESRTLAEIVVESASAEAPEFATLLAAVQAADPAVFEALSDPEAELTVFAPTDAAFAALAEALGEEAFNGVLTDPAALTNILLYHVLDGRVSSTAIAALLADAADGLSLTMLNGSEAVLTATEDGIFINDAQIVMTDVDAANGVVHVIDAVIVPPAE